MENFSKYPKVFEQILLQILKLVLLVLHVPCTFILSSLTVTVIFIKSQNVKESSHVHVPKEQICQICVLVEGHVC